MGEDRLDKFMRDQVFDHKTPADTDQLWAGILAKQEKKEEPKRRFLWLWFLGGLLIGGSLIGYFVFTSNESANQIASTNEITSNTENEADSKLASGQNNNTATIESNATELNSVVPNSPKSNTVISKSDVISEKETTTTSATNNRKETEETAINNSTPPSKNELNVQATKNIGKTTGTPNSATLLNTDLEESSSTLTQAESPISSVPTVESPNKENTSSLAPAAVSPLAQAELEKEGTVLSMLTLRTLNTSIDLVDPIFKLKKEDFPPIVTVPVPATIIPNKKASPFSIGVNMGYGFANNQLKAGNGENTAAYKQLREETETTEQVLSAGLDLKYQLKSGLYAKVGLQFEQITDRFDYSNVSATSFFNDTAIQSIKYVSIDSTEITRGTNSTRIRIQGREIYNRYRSFDLPLLVGYHSRGENRLSWFAEAGVLVNIGFFASGEILDTDGETIIDLAESDVLRKNLGLTVTGGLGLSYRLTKGLSVWASPRVRYGLKNMTTEPELLEQRYLRGALEVGVRVGF